MTERSQRRNDRLIQEQVHDTYKLKNKLVEPTVCPACEAVYRGGRWQWGLAPAEATRQHCPACLRTQDRYPAGSVTLAGPFLQAHREEILNLARNHEEKEKAEHPLKRIMAIEPDGDGMLITTTDPHLARGIGEALHRAYDGELDFAYVDESDLLRVSWRR